VQPLEEERDSELVPAGSEPAVVLEMQREEERIAPLPRRAVLHGVLALFATPLAGGLLLAARLIAMRRGALAIATAAAALAVTGLGVAFALLAPVPAGAAAVLALLMWAASGVAAAAFESRLGLAPLVPWSSDPRPGLQALTWGATLLVSGISVAFGLAVITTRWGMEILGKPSAPRQILLMGLVALVPTGVLMGLARAALRRPHRLAPPVVFGAAFYLSLLSAGCAQLLWQWLARSLSRTEEIAASQSLGVTGFLSFAGLAVWLVLLLFLAESRRTLDFVQRLVAVTALSFLYVGNADLVLSDGPVSWRNRWAETAAAEGRHADAARHWDWTTIRAPRIAETVRMVEKGAREALLAGDPALARRLLLRIDGEVAREGGVDEQAATARALLASRLDLDDLGGVRSVRVAPVSREDYLDSDWSALLTAVRSVRTELGETEVKQRLQDLSDSPTATSLPSLSPLLELKVAADLFGLRAVALPYRDKDRLLAAGIPVLVHLPAWDRWLLVFWSAPGADAVLVLDYELWGGEEQEDMDREEVARLLVGDEGPESRTARALARVAALHADSRIARLLDRDGGRAFALVPRNGPAPLQSLPDVPAGLLTLELARRELARGAAGRGLKLAAEIPPGPARDELLATVWLGETGREALAPGDAPAAEAVARRLTAGPLSRVSPWFLGRLEELSVREDPRFCALREKALRENLALRPDLDWRLKELAARAASTGRAAEAAGLALRYAASSRWEDSYILDALDILARMPGAGENPAVRPVLERLTGELDLLLLEGTGVRPRSAAPPYLAARAALARDPDDAVDGWREAVALEPKSMPYRKRLAEALERAGRREAAAEARHWAGQMDVVSLCPGSQP